MEYGKLCMVCLAVKEPGKLSAQRCNACEPQREDVRDESGQIVSGAVENPWPEVPEPNEKAVRARSVTKWNAYARARDKHRARHARNPNGIPPYTAAMFEKEE